MTAHASTCPLDHIQVGEGVPCQLPWLPHGPVWGDSTGRLLDDGDDDDCNLFEILFNGYSAVHGNYKISAALLIFY